MSHRFTEETGLMRMPRIRISLRNLMILMAILTVTITLTKRSLTYSRLS